MKEPKPSHHQVNMGYFMKGLERNLEMGQIKVLHLIKLKPTIEGW